MHDRKKLVLSLTCLASLGYVTAYANVSQSSSTQKIHRTGTEHKINVVAAEDFYGEVAKAVGGSDVNVISLIANPNQDPHSYEPTTAASRNVANAQIVISDGIGYDAWMDNLISASRLHGKIVIHVASDLMGKKLGDNEHVWYIPTTMSKLATTLANDMSKIDPSHSSLFHQRANHYVATLQPFQDKVKQLRRSTPTPIASSELVFDYMAQALNLQITSHSFGKAINDGIDPPASSIADLETDLRTKRVKMFVYDIQNSTPTVEQMVKIAQENKIPIVRVTETEPAGEDYEQWMTQQSNQVGKALGVH